MRFQSGNLPEKQATKLIADGWQQAPALTAKQIQNYGLFIACAGMLLIAVLLRGAFRPSSVWSALLIMVLAVPLHELIHALSTPSLGLSDRTVIGFQSGKGLFMPYMYYDGTQPLWHMLLTGLTPVLFLTVLPILLAVFAPLNEPLRANLGFLAFFNIAISGGDLVNFFWTLTHLPFNATVQLSGWSLLWKV